MKTSSIVQLLGQSPVFAKADKAMLQTLAKDATLLSLEDRQHLFHMGHEASHFYLIQSGNITLYRPSFTGERKVFRVIKNGDLLVETAMFLSPPEYPLSAQATGEVTCYCLPREGLLQLCHQSPEFCQALLGGMAERIFQSLNRIDLLTVGSAAQRLVLYLIDLYSQQRSSWLEQPYNQAVLARQLNITPETLSRGGAAQTRSGVQANIGCPPAWQQLV